MCTHLRERLGHTLHWSATQGFVAGKPGRETVRRQQSKSQSGGGTRVPANEGFARGLKARSAVDQYGASFAERGNPNTQPAQDSGG
jgi:hypothetical protein